MAQAHLLCSRVAGAAHSLHPRSATTAQLPCSPSTSGSVGNLFLGLRKSQSLPLQRNRLAGQDAGPSKIFCSSESGSAAGEAPRGLDSGISHLPVPVVARREDVDQELWDVLELCSEDELEHLHDILYGPSPLSPVIKSLVQDNEPPAIVHRGRTSLMRRIESRFRFLAADSAAMLKGRRPSYREALLAVRDRLRVQCPGSLATQDLETEIFMHMLERYSDTIEGLGVSSAAVASAYVAHSDGMASTSCAEAAPKGGRWREAVEQVAAPLKLGGAEFLPTLAKLGSALGLTSLRTAALRQLGANVMAQSLRYEAVLQLVCKSSVLSGFKRQAALQAAQRGVTTAAARYSFMRGALSTLGPLMWVWLSFDLALKAIGTDYGRVVRAIFALASVRLVRTHGFVSPA